jgi:hypothetical protein
MHMEETIGRHTVSFNVHVPELSSKKSYLPYGLAHCIIITIINFFGNRECLG